VREPRSRENISKCAVASKLSEIAPATVPAAIRLAWALVGPHATVAERATAATRGRFCAAAVCIYGSRRRETPLRKSTVSAEEKKQDPIDFRDLQVL
jgi:hypothetical protein